jgi:hypothetical protein
MIAAFRKHLSAPGLCQKRKVSCIGILPMIYVEGHAAALGDAVGRIFLRHAVCLKLIYHFSIN